jgi:hypothetical protein
MTLNDLRKSLQHDRPPAHLDPVLQALWYDGKGDWNAAHDIAQQANTPSHCWVHAYLHRKEGDSENAAYWYHRARQPVPTFSLEEEWQNIIRTLLNA